MKKYILYILGILFLFCMFTHTSYAVTGANNINIGGGAGGAGESSNAQQNDKLDLLEGPQFVEVSTGGERGIYLTLIRVARDLKNFFYIIATIFFLIICLQLMFASNTEEQVNKFKKGIIWITVGLIVMQIAFAFVETVFDRGVNARLGASILENVVYPLIQLVQTLASVFFIAMAFYAFYRLITANGNEEAVKTGRITILYAIIGFIVLNFARALVEAFYGKISCTSFGGGFVVGTGENCINSVDISEGSDIIITIINWLNGFVAIIVMLMILYAGAQILLSQGDEERIKKGKQSIIYIAIGLFILFANYLILTFFLVPETAI